jgi:hypothetical protein
LRERTETVNVRIDLANDGLRPEHRIDGYAQTRISPLTALSTGWISDVGPLELERLVRNPEFGPR